MAAITSSDSRLREPASYQATSSNHAMPAQRRVFPPALRDVLAQRFGARFSTGKAMLDNHARGESPFVPQPPDAVVFAQTQQ